VTFIDIQLNFGKFVNFYCFTIFQIGHFTSFKINLDFVTLFKFQIGNVRIS